MKKAYLDNAATTPVDPRVIETMLPYFREHFGNPVSFHEWGEHTSDAIEAAREQAEAEQAASEAGLQVGVHNLLMGTPENIAEQIANFAEVGVSYFMFYVHGLHDPKSS